MSIRNTLGRLLPLLAALAWLASAAASPVAAQTATTDIGYKDQSYGTIGGSITGSKPESKLWFNDGIWWADMYSTAVAKHRIFRLNRVAQTWSDGGTTLDSRAGSRSDILWHAATGKLYVASHSYTSSSGSAGIGTDGRLWRYSYNSTAKTYSLDEDFPSTSGQPRPRRWSSTATRPDGSGPPGPRAIGSGSTTPPAATAPGAPRTRCRAIPRSARATSRP